MDSYTQLLRDLHTYLHRIQSVREELSEGPARVKRLAGRVSAAEKALADHQAQVKALKVKIHENETSVKANVEKVKKHQRDLDTSTSKKEFDALNVEVAALQKRNRDLEDETFSLMTQVEELSGRTPELEKAISQAKEVHAKAEAEYQEQLPAWQSRLAEAQSLVVEKTVLLPMEWKKMFQRLEQSGGAEALAPLTGRSCSACYTGVTAQQFALINAGQISACKSCGKILFLPE